MKARWRKLRELYVAADRDLQAKKKLSDYQKELVEECYFLKPHIKHHGLGKNEAIEAKTKVQFSDVHDDSITDSCDETDDPMVDAAENQLNLEKLCQEAEEDALSRPRKRKRDSLAQITQDFPKKPKAPQVEDAGGIFLTDLTTLTNKIEELQKKSDILLKARARAILVCNYLDKMPVNVQILCPQKILEIFEKYR